MSLGYYMADGRLLETVFKAAGGNQTFGYLDASGKDIGQILYAGSSATNAGYLCSDGVDIGRRLMGNVTVTAWGVNVKNNTPGEWTCWLSWTGSHDLRHKFVISGNGSGSYRITNIYIVWRSGKQDQYVKSWRVNSINGNTVDVTVNVTCYDWIESVYDIHAVIFDNIAGGSFDVHYGYYYQTRDPCDCDCDCGYSSDGDGD
jgi:hypothetical protein